MNNARYLRELDFARFHYYGLTGIYAKGKFNLIHKFDKILDILYYMLKTVRKMGGGAVQGASSVRYRRTIPIFTPYKITTGSYQCHVSKITLLFIIHF
jgi:hypothetical protein